MIAIAYAVAILLPLLFLYLIYAQDLYGQGRFSHVLLSFGGGLAAFGGAYGIAVLLKAALAGAWGSAIEAQNWLDMWLPILIAPFIEEVLKSLALLLLSRRMTYFVDGAIYGFAAGIAFSILENALVYIPRAGGATFGLIMLAVVRAFSTCLMHGAASALVGTAIGRFRYGHGARRLLMSVLGWVAAILLHMGFNGLTQLGFHLAQQGSGLSWAPVVGAFAVGIGGAVLILLFIRWGLREEKRWMEETLGLRVGVTQREVAVVRQFDKIDELLEPFVAIFGREAGERVEALLLKQGQLGIKRKARALSQEARDQERLDGEIARLQKDMEDIRSQLGMHCMIFVRTILPLDQIDLTSIAEREMKRLEAKGVVAGADGSMQAALAARMGSSHEAEQPVETQGIFGWVQRKSNGA